MSGFWIKGIEQTSYVTFALFFGMIFLNISGVSFFPSEAFTAKAVVIIFFFMLLNVFFTLNWK